MSNKNNPEPALIAGVSPQSNQATPDGAAPVNLVQRRLPEENFDAVAHATSENAVDTFTPFADGALMKHTERPMAAPQRLLFDGAGKMFGIARNQDVAELICNGVNFMVLAQAQLKAEPTPEAKSLIILPGKN